MFRILDAALIAPGVKRFRIHAPRIARKRQAGQFVILRVNEAGERIPLTMADADAEAGSITIIVQGVGKTTQLLNDLGPGDAIADVTGPLGMPTSRRPRAGDSHSRHRRAANPRRPPVARASVAEGFGGYPASVLVGAERRTPN